MQFLPRSGSRSRGWWSPDDEDGAAAGRGELRVAFMAPVCFPMWGEAHRRNRTAEMPGVGRIVFGFGLCQCQLTSGRS